jgi:8-oxo-dGTP diphosphatase
MAKRIYEKPSVTVDCVIVRREAETGRPHILLIQRAKEPFAGRWALPGGFVNKDEPLIEAARRELREETGLRVAKLRQVGAFGDPGRDPRGWTVSVAYLAELSGAKHKVQAADDAQAVKWFPLDGLPRLAFDHGKILKQALAVLSTGNAKVMPSGR